MHELKFLNTYYLILNTMKFPISRYTVNGNSMSPSLRPGQDVLSFNWAYLGKKPKKGDIVVVIVNRKDMVKRVERVMGNELWIRGDNRDEGTDSRDFGAITIDNVVGKVIYTSSHPEQSEGSLDSFQNKSGDSSASPQNDKYISCPSCGGPIIGVYGRKDAICTNCGFKLACCGEP